MVIHAHFAPFARPQAAAKFTAPMPTPNTSSNATKNSWKARGISGSTKTRGLNTIPSPQ